MVLCAGCNRSLSPARAGEVERDVRAFAGAVAHDVTHDGPAAWQRLFEESPAFFMASEGRLVFPDRASARTAIDELVRTVKQIELKWGDDLRVDPLTEDLAILGASYHEIRLGIAGDRVDESGFFTGTVEHHGGRWQFRNAHWSVVTPPPAVR